jgi:hypothetical protein
MYDQTGAELWSFSNSASLGNGFSFSPDGSKVAAVLGSGIGIWDATTGVLLGSLPEPDVFPEALKYGFSGDGSKLVVNSPAWTKVWDVSRLELPSVTPGRNQSRIDVLLSCACRLLGPKKGDAAREACRDRR